MGFQTRLRPSRFHLSPLRVEGQNAARTLTIEGVFPEVAPPCLIPPGRGVLFGRARPSPRSPALAERCVAKGETGGPIEGEGKDLLKWLIGAYRGMVRVAISHRLCRQSPRPRRGSLSLKGCPLRIMFVVNSYPPCCNSLGFHLALTPTAACSAGMNCEARDSVPGWGWDKAKAYS